MANIKELEKALDESLEAFRVQTISDIQNMGEEALTKYDFEEITRQTYYVFNDFKKHIIDYLKDIK